MDGNDKLEPLLQDVVNNTDALKKLSSETGRGRAPTRRRPEHEHRRSKAAKSPRPRRPAQEVEPPRQDHRRGPARRDDEQREALAKDLIGEFVDQVMAGTMTVSKDTQAMINAADRRRSTALISKQLNAILHHEDFQKLEASWRGLHYFVHQTETGTMLKIRVMNASKKDLPKDMERAAEFDQSALFKKVYEEEFGTFGGAPFGALIGDYEFSRHPQDIALLEKISNVAAAAHAPFISAAEPAAVQLGRLHRALRPPRPGQDLRDAPTTPSGGRSASRKTRATSASACPTS